MFWEYRGGWWEVPVVARKQMDMIVSQGIECSWGVEQKIKECHWWRNHRGLGDQEKSLSDDIGP